MRLVTHILVRPKQLSIIKHWRFAQWALRSQATLPQPWPYAFCVKLMTAGQDAQLIPMSEGIQTDTAHSLVAIAAVI